MIKHPLPIFLKLSLTKILIKMLLPLHLISPDLFTFEGKKKLKVKCEKWLSSKDS